MRTPKYKAFYKPHNYIYHVTDMNFEGPYYTLREVKLSNGIWLRSDKLDDIILLEQTPYTDKNGEKIYEGDVLKTFPIISSDKIAYDSFNVVVRFTSSSWIANGVLGIKQSEISEIIGNIYKNPELIYKTPTHEH